MAARRRPTVHDVARRAGVSIATVSFAFRRPDQVRARTREAVLRAAREIGYIPSASARSLVRGKTGALGLHSYEFLLEQPLSRTVAADQDGVTGPGPDPVPDLGRAVVPWADLTDGARADLRAYPLYVDEVQRGFELEARRHGRPVLLGRGDPAEGGITETAGRVDGLAIFPGRSSQSWLEEVTLNMPVVLFSAPPRDDRYHRVLVDNHGGMVDLVTHLVRDHQARDLAFVGSQNAFDFRERFDGFRSGLRELGLSAPDQVADDSDIGLRPSFPGVLELLHTGRLPDALVCSSDQLALELLDLLHREGVSVPEQVIVTGFDGILAGMLSSPTLTTVRQPMEAMGRIAADLLMQEPQDEPEQTADDAPRTGRVVRLGAGLERRASCGCSG